MHMYTHADLSVKEGVTALLPCQLTLSHVARLEPRPIGPRQPKLTCMAESMALSAALATADAYS